MLNVKFGAGAKSRSSSGSGSAILVLTLVMMIRMRRHSRRLLADTAKLSKPNLANGIINY
jgi:hypothetical protein